MKYTVFSFLFDTGIVFPTRCTCQPRKGPILHGKVPLRKHFYFRHPAINMRPKKTLSIRGRGKGKKNSSSSKCADQPVNIHAGTGLPDQAIDIGLLPDKPDPPAGIAVTASHDETDVPDRSRSQTPASDHSRESSVSSSVSIAVSIQDDDPGKKKKKRARKNPCNLSIDDEELMLEFIRDNPVLWNIKMTDYRRKDKKDKIWEDQAQLMNKTADTLKGWFRSLRDTHTRLDKRKSGAGAPQLTEREEWIITKFAFLKTVTRHRPEPLQSVSIQLLYFS